MSDIRECLETILQFREEREWKQFHNGKDMALSLMLEAAELLEHFQFKDQRQFEEYLSSHRETISDELADVFIWILFMSNDFEINLVDALKRKMEKNAQKYPVEKAKGNAKKYTEFE